jgi:hypothetical protein
VKQALSAPSKPLSVIKRERGEIAQVFIEASIVGAMQMIKAGKMIGVEVVPEIAAMILTKYYWYKPEDIQLCMRMGVSGAFGKNYDVFDAQTIMLWLDQYDAIRTAEKTTATHKIDGSQNTIAQIASHPQLTEILSDVTSKLSIKETTEQPEEREDIFDDDTKKLVGKLHDEYVTLRGNATFAQYNGATVDATEYIKIRIKEINQNQPK